ncbi:hypothetical protein [Streptomyces sp. YIM S03343]
MSDSPTVLDELHELVNGLEDEGHSLAGRFRDLVEHIKHEVGHLLGGGKNELDAFVQGLVSTLVPELDKIRDEIVAQVLAELRKTTGEVVNVLHIVEHAAPAVVTAEDAAPTAPEQAELAPASAQG